MDAAHGVNLTTSFRSLDSMGVALFIALVLHAFIILSVSFDVNRETPPQPELTLDITLVHNQSKPEKPKEAQFLAQKDNQGGGEEVVKKRTTSPLGSPDAITQNQPKPQKRQSAAAKPQVKVERKVVTSKKSKPKVQPKIDKRPAPQPKKISIAELMANTQVEIDRLTAELDARAQNAASKDRRKAVSADTREFKYADYMDTWRRKVERIGNLNYPDEARRNKLFGNLLMHVSVRADGTVEKIRIAKSSGYRVLDDAAVRIVRLASPYAPFPPEIRKEVDVLDIIRTWKFERKSGNAFRFK